MEGFNCLMFLGFLGLSLGIGIALGSDVGQEADGAGRDKIVMLYVRYPLKLTCNFTDPEDENDEDTNDDKRTAVPLDWYRDDELLEETDRMKIFQENSSLVIGKALKDDLGTYKCQTRADPDLFKTIRVIYLQIKTMDKSNSVVEKQTIEIDCLAEGVPPPAIMWLKDQNPIAEVMANDSRITVINGTLTISDAQWGDRGNYTCVVTSLLKSYEKWTFLRIKDVYAALWPFIGIVIEVVILGIIIIIFEKRRAKAEFDESDTDPGNDQKNTADRSKDMRRRK